jgi:hypothetical protein
VHETVEAVAWLGSGERGDVHSVSRSVSRSVGRSVSRSESSRHV